MMREQMQCLGRMLVRSSNDVPQCDNVEWMWAQCRSCCCSWININLRTPRTRGSSLKKTAGMQQQYQQQHPQTPVSRNQWRQQKERSDSEDSSGTVDKLMLDLFSDYTSLVLLCLEENLNLIIKLLYILTLFTCRRRVQR